MHDQPRDQLSFVCALQVESFRKFGEHAFASTMCTGNLRIATEHLNRYFSEKDRGSLDTALRYYGIDLVFASAVLVGYWVTRAFGVRAVWWAMLVPAEACLNAFCPSMPILDAGCTCCMETFWATG